MLRLIRSIRFSNFLLSPVDLGPTVQSASQSHLIGESHVSSARQAKTDSRDPDRSTPYDHFLQVMASGFPFHIVAQGQNHLAYFVALDFSPQRFNVQFLGSNPSDWGQLSMQNVIFPPVGSRSLHGEKIGHAFQNAKDRIVSLGGSANFTFVRLTQVAA